MTICGGPGQTCCEIGGTAVPRFCSAPGTICSGDGNNATCAVCGGMGQRCCEDRTCRQGQCQGFANPTCQ
jgi:hypothetical protein